MESDLTALAERLIEAYDSATKIAPFSASMPDFTVADAYGVLAEIEARRRGQGWRSVGRKIGFTNQTIWERYGVWQPMWAHIWSHTVQDAVDDKARLSLAKLVQPRIEPEVVFGLKGPLPLTEDPAVLLDGIDWLAPGFEIVQSHFPDWNFTAADCTAAFGLHGALAVGTRVPVTESNRTFLQEVLPRFQATLSQGGEVVDRGTGANVLGSPLKALARLVRVLSELPQFPPLAAGEIVTTGTLTDAWPVQPGETWSSDYGELGLKGLTLNFE